ncbi:hypothetical protein IFM89_016013 [Coptis chinensis]|uniref:BRCA1-associated 2/ETP1 RRM domain-containing protein n=1 Tax=Coptis chinensis TaxID=261450 RepID=A0A835I9Z7_9MAGN|nr:hypothetical protein IFM89_016013 [Coptis chinensis]
MFSLKIHSIDTHNLLKISSNNTSTTTSNTSNTFTNPNPKVQESRGILHLYRNISTHFTNQEEEEEEKLSSPLLFVIAVPSHFSSDDFLRFCGSYFQHVSEILLIRNDAMEDRYSVLIRLVDEKRADDFYRNFNGRRFFSTEYLWNIQNWQRLLVLLPRGLPSYLLVLFASRGWTKTPVEFWRHFATILSSVPAFPNGRILLAW